MTDLFIWQIYEVDVAETTAGGRSGPLERVDVTGFEVEATDGAVGKVDEATYELGRGSLVVDTGFWIFGKKRMIPAGLITGLDPDARTVQLGVSKDDVKGAPDFDELRKADPSFRDDVARHYAALRGDPIGPVAGTGRAPGEMSGDTIAPVAGIGHDPDTSRA